MAGQVLERRAAFAKGRYYVEIAAEPEGDHRAALAPWTAALEKTIEGRTTPPDPVAWFPAEGRAPGHPRFVPQSVLGIRLLKRGYMADYSGGRAFAVPQPSVEAARDVFAKLAERFQAKPARGPGEEAASGSDPYLDHVCIFRQGRVVAGWAKAPDPAAAVQGAQKIRDSIR